MSAWCGITTASLLFALVGAPGVAPAQDKWPSKPIRMIVPFTALVTGAIHYYIYPLPAIVTLLKAGTLKALAVTSAKRAAALPDLPTSAEAGFPEYVSESWFGPPEHFATMQRDEYAELGALIKEIGMTAQ